MNKYIYHILLVIMTLMTTWTFSSCSDESFDVDSNGYGKLKFEAILPGSNDMSTRTVYVQDQYGKLKSGWGSNDRINVYGFTSGTNTFTNPDIDDSSDDISRWSNSEAVYQKGENLVAVYPASTISDGVVEMDFSNQDGTLENLKNYDLMVSDKVPYEQAEVKFQMVRKNVFLRIEVQKSSFGNSAEGITITISGTKISKASLNLSDGTYSFGGTDNIQFTNTRTDIPESDGYYLFYVAVPCVNETVPMTNIRISKGNTTRTKSFDTFPKMKPGYIYSTRLADITNWDEKALLKYGRDVNSAISELVGGAGNVKKIIFEVNSTRKIEDYSNYKDLHFDFLEFNANIYAVHEGNGVVVIFTPGSVIYYNNNPSGMFKGFSNLEEIENLAIVQMEGGAALQIIRNISDMFYGCTSLKKLDVSSFVTTYQQNLIFNIVTYLKDMRRMFYNCRSLQVLNLGKDFDLDKLKIPFTNINYVENIFANMAKDSRKVQIITTETTKQQILNDTGSTGFDESVVEWSIIQ